MSAVRGTFLIPTWDKTSFREDYKNAEGVEREFVKVVDWVCRIAQFLLGAPISGPTVGWYALWSKHFHVCAASRSAYMGNSSFLLGLLGRPLLELFLQISTIGNPLWRGGDPELTDFDDISPATSPEELRDRLAGYCAWCLEQDLRLIEDRLEPELLDSLFDYRWQRNFARSLGADLERHEREFGEIEIVGDAEARLDRERYEERLGHQRDEIDRLIEELDLAGWMERIRVRKGNRPSIHFPELFAAPQEQKPKSMKAHLRMIGMPWAYWHYGRQSGLLHQSSLLSSIRLGPGGFRSRSEGSRRASFAIYEIDQAGTDPGGGSLEAGFSHGTYS